MTCCPIPQDIKDFYHDHFCEKKAQQKVTRTRHFKSFSVAVFSIFSLVIAVLNVVVIYQTGVEDSKFRDLAYIISALLAFLGVVGLYSIHFPKKPFWRHLLVACWFIAAFAVTILSIWEMDLLLTSKKAATKDICQKNLLIWDSNFNGDPGGYEPKALAKVVNECYVFVAMAAAFELFFQVVGTIFGIIIAIRYRRKARAIPEEL
ncbi:hypothetical protein BGZ79_009181 [Entomortierella chlamydospora]|nr:hypothetical protein BGZ79_009181 [Entomortierella chlamydospora]